MALQLRVSSLLGVATCLSPRRLRPFAPLGPGPWALSLLMRLHKGPRWGWGWALLPFLQKPGRALALLDRAAGWVSIERLQSSFGPFHVWETKAQRRRVLCESQNGLVLRGCSSVSDIGGPPVPSSS